MQSIYAEQERKTVSSFEAGRARIKGSGIIANAQYKADIKKLEQAKALFQATFGVGKLPANQLQQLKTAFLDYTHSLTNETMNHVKKILRKNALESAIQYVLKPLQHKTAAKKLLRYFQNEISKLGFTLDTSLLKMTPDEFKKHLFEVCTAKERKEAIVEIFSSETHHNRKNLITAIKTATSDELAEIFDLLKTPEHIRDYILLLTLSAHANQPEFLSGLFFKEPKVLTSNEIADTIHSLKSKNRDKEVTSILAMLKEANNTNIDLKHKLFCYKVRFKCKDLFPQTVTNSVSSESQSLESNFSAASDSETTTVFASGSSLNGEIQSSTTTPDLSDTQQLLTELRNNGITLDEFLTSLNQNSKNYEKTKEKGFEQALAKGNIASFVRANVDSEAKKKDVVSAVAYIQEIADPGLLTRIFRFLMSHLPFEKTKKSAKEAEELTLKARLEIFNIALAADAAKNPEKDVTSLAASAKKTAGLLKEHARGVVVTPVPTTSQGIQKFTDGATDLSKDMDDDCDSHEPTPPPSPPLVHSNVISASTGNRSEHEAQRKTF